MEPIQQDGRLTHQEARTISIFDLGDPVARPVGRSRPAAVYVLGMGLAATAGSAFFIGGLVAQAEGLAAVALAAGFPLAGLVWAIALSALHRGDSRHVPVTNYRVVEETRSVRQ